ncbi:1-deoxy-D-xylulose-5-phosphate reductoisomerase [Kocuria sp. JC486]|uniref:1-deoxy-D-xylulose-5-phosphate reductoisomerase n=1 Tax=Kocuria sp. JC486 TaxID=1970736 RepID=UPI001422F32B|nr:1-deoxy-D-xylulose-5-phosphate reductoisomerase [Kocuria sp. JC486]NHU85127.1 1-deoxy-D-xylulose-5-phosphate reductoisomerase [Kocuria sp. JC486]
MPAAQGQWEALLSDGVRRVSILGSTGSIGTQALDVVRKARKDAGQEVFRVVALAAGASNLALLARQAVETRAELVATSGDADAAAQLADAISNLAGTLDAGHYRPRIIHGPEAATRAAAVEDADLVLNGITGSIGLAPTLAALESNKLLALANKESLIAGGALIHQAVAASTHEDPLIPVDSEHSALAQALRSGSATEVDRLILTASGGPFRGRTREQLRGVKPADALAHPTWDMGLMVTTNSATMVNKALEVLEAHLLFGVELDRIDVVVHPQSVVHSMVQFTDGSTMAQASPPDMRLPIALGLGWPHRVPGAATPCDWSRATQWTFEPLDEDAFPAVRLIKEAAARGATAPAVYNAANEQAVLAFHAGRIGFLDIVDTVARVVEEHQVADDLTVKAVLEAERWARTRADQLLID